MIDARWDSVGREIRELRTRVDALERGDSVSILSRDPQEQAMPEGKHTCDTVAGRDREMLLAARERITDLTRELEGARRVAENQRRIANERTDERDEAVRELERLRLEVEERAESRAEETHAPAA